MSGTFDHQVDAAHRGKTAAELLAAPVAALKGVSEADGERLDDAFGVRTVEDLATQRFFLRAQTMLQTARLRHDPGPSPDWQAFFETAPIDHYVAHPSERFRIHFGPVFYRGRLDGTSRLIVVGQDPSTNEILAHRIFIGRSGQRVQRLLAKVGLTRSYTLINTYLFSVFGQFFGELETISEEPEVLGYRNAFLDRLKDENPVQAVLAIGSAARHAVENWPGKGGLPVFEITHPSATDEVSLLASWTAALPGLIEALDPDEGIVADPTPYGTAFTDADMAEIPAYDVPFWIPDFQRRDGGHSGRDGDRKIEWNAPAGPHFTV